jgi:hypothetical protein
MRGDMKRYITGVMKGWNPQIYGVLKTDPILGRMNKK